MTGVPNRYERDPGATGFPTHARRRRGVHPSQRGFEAGAEFDRMRETAEQYACRPYPLGCGATAGHTCHVINRNLGKVDPHAELTAQPAHMCRLQDAGVWARISKVGDGARRPETDRDPAVPPPAANRPRDSGALRENDPWAAHQRTTEQEGT